MPSIDKIWEPIKAVTGKKDFAIAYSENGMVEPSMLTHKIFCFGYHEWEKIELKFGIRELDTLNGVFSTVEKDVTLKKVCSKQESEIFLSKIDRLGIFTLVEEDKLLVKCKEDRQDHSVPLYQDASYITFYIIHDKKVKILPTRMSTNAKKIVQMILNGARYLP